MPSSTSSSSGWSAGLWTTAAVFVILFGALELGLRASGRAPSANDELALWVAHRRAAVGAGRDTVVVLGKSRVQLGLDLDEARLRFPELRFIQLAAHGVGAAAVLRDLAQDETFGGIVVWSLTEVDLTRQARDEQTARVNAHARDKSWDRRLNARGAAILQSKLVALDRHASLQSIARGNPIQFWQMAPDRSQRAEFARTDAAALTKLNRDKRAYETQLAERFGGVNPSAWLREASEVDPWVRAIQARGGEVVYLKFPACDEVEAFSERWYPRARFWEPLTRQTPAKAVHYADVPGVAPLSCPDSSHIGAPDRARVTRALLRAISHKL